MALALLAIGWMPQIVSWWPGNTYHASEYVGPPTTSPDTQLRDKPVVWLILVSIGGVIPQINRWGFSITTHSAWKNLPEICHYDCKASSCGQIHGYHHLKNMLLWKMARARDGIQLINPSSYNTYFRRGPLSPNFALSHNENHSCKSRFFFWANKDWSLLFF